MSRAECLRMRMADGSTLELATLPGDRVLVLDARDARSQILLRRLQAVLAGGDDDGLEWGSLPASRTPLFAALSIPGPPRVALPLDKPLVLAALRHEAARASGQLELIRELARLPASSPDADTLRTEERETARLEALLATRSSEIEALLAELSAVPALAAVDEPTLLAIFDEAEVAGAKEKALATLAEAIRREEERLRTAGLDLESATAMAAQLGELRSEDRRRLRGLQLLVAERESEANVAREQLERARQESEEQQGSAAREVKREQHLRHTLVGVAGASGAAAVFLVAPWFTGTLSLVSLSAALLRRDRAHVPGLRGRQDAAEDAAVALASAEDSLDAARSELAELMKLAGLQDRADLDRAFNYHDALRELLELSRRRDELAAELATERVAVEARLSTCCGGAGVPELRHHLHLRRRRKRIEREMETESHALAASRQVRDALQAQVRERQESKSRLEAELEQLVTSWLAPAREQATEWSKQYFPALPIAFATPIDPVTPRPFGGDADLQAVLAHLAIGHQVQGQPAAPLVLEDSLGLLDDATLKAALAFLAEEIAPTRQVIVLASRLGTVRS